MCHCDGYCHQEGEFKIFLVSYISCFACFRYTANLIAGKELASTATYVEYNSNARLIMVGKTCI